MRRTTILWFLVAACLGVALFLVKYEVQEREARLADLHRQILENQEAVHVLEAEWSYLNRPSRLEALVRRHLKLIPLDTTQLGQIERLPMRQPAVPGEPSAADDITAANNAPSLLSPAVPAPVLSTPPSPLARPLPVSAGGQQ